MRAAFILADLDRPIDFRFPFGVRCRIESLGRCNQLWSNLSGKAMAIGAFLIKELGTAVNVL
jgi:hypothetical protein